MSQFEKNIKNKIKETKVSPSPALWSKVDAALDATPTKKGAIIIPIWGAYAKYGIAAAVAFLLGGTTMLFLNNGNNSNPTTGYAHEHVANTDSNQIQHLASQVTALLADAEKTEDDKEDQGNVKSSDTNNSQEEEDNSQNIEEIIKFKKDDVVKDQALIAYNDDISDVEFLDQKSSYSLSIIDEENEEDYFEVEELENEPVFDNRFKNTAIKRLGYRGLWLGMEIGYVSSYTGDYYYKGNGFGFNLGYDFSNMLGIQSGLRYEMLRKEIFTEDIEGNRLLFISNMSSVKLPLAMRVKLTKISERLQRPTSVNFVFGGEYGYNGANNFHQLGVTSGIEYDIFMNGETMLTLGLRGGFAKNLNYQALALENAASPYQYNIGAFAAIRFITPSRK